MSQTIEKHLPSRLESVPVALALIGEQARAAGFDAEACGNIDLAVSEAVTNAIIHGNAQSDTKSVGLRIEVSDAAMSVTVRDEGAGFDPEAVPDPTEDDNLLKTSGRGLLFMRAFMDEVAWSKHPSGGTVVTLTKKR